MFTRCHVVGIKSSSVWIGRTGQELGDVAAPRRCNRRCRLSEAFSAFLVKLFLLDRRFFSSLCFVLFLSVSLEFTSCWRCNYERTNGRAFCDNLNCRPRATNFVGVLNGRKETFSIEIIIIYKSDSSFKCSLLGNVLEHESRCCSSSSCCGSPSRQSCLTGN